MSHTIFQDSGFGEMIYAFTRSDWLGKGICVALLLLSVVASTIVVEKILSLRSALRKSRKFMADFRTAGNLFELRKSAERTVSPAGEIYLAALERFKTFNAVQPDRSSRFLTEKEIGLLRTAMERAADDQLQLLGRFMMSLSSVISLCPFLGLFGTVWGITAAFSRLARAGRADVQTLAPGVSGALLTTVAAIFVVIPAMLGNNWIVSLYQDTETLLDDAVEEIAARFQTEYT